MRPGLRAGHGTIAMAEQSRSDFLPPFPHFATDAIHYAQEPEQWNCRAVVPPITLTTSFKQEEARENQVFTVGFSLGGFESLAAHPATMSHASLSPELKEHLGITENLIRLSVGLEDEEDLLQDLDQALKAAVISLLSYYSHLFSPINSAQKLD
ncbi:cystathionine gamma-lyase-like protein [Turdus rufiventris]|nr:cystathionine gamma-lyase-like protein [Turdus rufiventris]